MKIPFSVLPSSPNAAFPDRRERDRPIVALYLSRGDKAVVAYALVDSGADSCVFPASVARSLDIEIPNERAAIFSGSLSESQVAYFAELEAMILPMESEVIDADQEPISFSLYAGFCETLEHVGMGLLGHDGFFSRFRVCFHAGERYFEVV